MSTRLRSPFAFLGRSAAASDDKDEDDKNKNKSKAEEGDDEDDKKDKDKDKKDDDAKGKSKAESDDDKKKDDDEDDDKSKSKKAKASDDDDESDTSAKKARARERDRVRAILTSPAGQADPVAAAHVALDTAMPRAEAIGMLTAMQVSRGAAAPVTSGLARPGLRERMEGTPNPTVGADASKGEPTIAERMIAADRRRRGEA